MFSQQIAACIEHDEKRRYLKGLPLSLIASQEHIPDAFYWMDFTRNNSN